MIRLTPPTPKGFISSGWGRPREYRGGWHEGLDFPADEGSPVLAAASGTVVHVDNVNNSFAGHFITIHHGGGMHTRYMHNLKNLVTKGQKVRRGEKIATVGRTGTSRSKPHVHFDVKFQDSAFEEYKRRYGTPTTGFGDKKSTGTGVPGETFMSGATYADIARRFAESKGVVFYSGVSAGVVLLLAGAGYLAWRAAR